MSETPLLPVDSRDRRSCWRRLSRLPAEDVPLAGTAGRYLAEPVVATLDLPPFTNSAMDGYALRAADTPGGSDGGRRVGRGRAVRGLVGPGEAVTISTGAVLPDGRRRGRTDRVDRCRDRLAAERRSSCRAPVPRDYAVRHAGSDVTPRHRGARRRPAHRRRADRRRRLPGR